MRHKGGKSKQYWDEERKAIDEVEGKEVILEDKDKKKKRGNEGNKFGLVD